MVNENSGANQIIGKWLGDKESMENDPEIKKMLEENTKTKFMIQIFSTVQMEITDNTINIQMEVRGKTETKINTYKVISDTPNSVLIENLDGDNAGDQTDITIIDSDHIKFTIPISSSAPPIILKKES